MAIAFLFWKLDLYSSVQGLILSFSTIKVDLTFGKILNICYGKSHSKYVAIAHVQKIPFSCMRTRVLFKKCRAKLLEETCDSPGFLAKCPGHLH